MMTLDLRRVSALAAKELAELRASKGVLLGPLSMVALAVLMPIVIAVGVPMWSGEPLDDSEDLIAIARDALGDGLGLTAAAQVQAFLIHQFLPLLALVPVVGAMTLVTTSIVGEKQARTLEPLLATPLSTAELLAAKTGTAFVVALVSLLVACVLLFGLVVTTALPGVPATLVGLRPLTLIFGVAPASSLVALTLGAIVSSRAKDARAAQQAGVVVVLPIVGAFVAQLNGQLVLDATDLAAAAAALLALAGALAVVAVRVFDRERILTRWT